MTTQYYNYWKLRCGFILLLCTFIPVSVTSGPKYAHRGFMLDTARKFFPVSSIFAILDRMAAAKMNVFHWHLTDNEGFNVYWSYENAKLTKAANNGGYYTHQDVWTVINYARSKGISVYPEFGMPAHVLAWSKAYPRDEMFHDEMEIMEEFNVNKPLVFTRIGALLDEMFPLFSTSRWVHLGHDETSGWNSLSDLKNSMNFVIRKAKEHKKKPVIWECPITDRGLKNVPKTFTIQVWKKSTDETTLRTILDQGYKVIISNTSYWFIHNNADGYFPSDYKFIDHPGVIGAELVWFTSSSDDPNNLDYVGRWIDAAGEKMYHG